MTSIDRFFRMLMFACVTMTSVAATPQVTQRGSKPPATRESGASLQDTLTWLKDRVARDGGFAENTYQPLEFATCTISWTDLRNGRPSGKTTVPLAELDPKQTKVEISPLGGDFSVRLTTKGRKSIKNEGESYSIMVSQINIIFKDRAIAQRVATAVAHAATMCGKEPF